MASVNSNRRAQLDFKSALTPGDLILCPYSLVHVPIVTIICEYSI